MRSNVPTIAPQLLRSRLSKICVAIIGSTPSEMIEKATAVQKENSFLENSFLIKKGVLLFREFDNTGWIFMLSLKFLAYDNNDNQY